MFVTGQDDFFQARQRSLQIRLRVRGRIHFRCVSTVQHAQYEEIVLEAKTTFKWQSSKEGQLRREDSFKDWKFSRPLALRPIYWEISSDAYTYFKMEYESELNTEIFSVRRFKILDQISRGHTRTLGEVQHKSPSRWNQSQSWKQKENNNRLPILVGLQVHTHTFTQPYILNKKHTALGHERDSPKSKAEKSNQKRDEPLAPLLRVESRWCH